MKLSEKIVNYYKKIQPPKNLPKGVDVLHPFNEPEVQRIVEEFYSKYYGDDNPRTFLIGINPGRFGGGATGIPFTDPIRLKEKLDISNDFEQKAELSSRFIYKIIEAIGAPEVFYGSFYFTSVSPLGFVMNGKNLNYYDIKQLKDDLEEYIVENLREQISFGAHPIAFSLGKGSNIKYLKWLNKKYQLFEDIKPLPHPRWVMQYRLKRLNEFIAQYKDSLSPLLM